MTVVIVIGSLRNRLVSVANWAGSTTVVIPPLHLKCLFNVAPENVSAHLLKLLLATILSTNSKFLYIFLYSGRCFIAFKFLVELNYTRATSS